MTWTRESLARTVDHTLLKPEATDEQVVALCAEAAELGTFSVCVSPSRLPVSLPDGIAVCTVVGFPSGAHDSEVKAACGDVLLKVILETAALSPEQVVEACRRSEAGGAQFVKTSTGFHPAGGASLQAVRLMRQTVGDRLGVKASGGIRDTATALSMLEAGASRLGLSGTRAVLDGLHT
ncbi:MAG: deoC [Frankiales bacterium]|nr:deoC [Frankiales bacterium]